MFLKIEDGLCIACSAIISVYKEGYYCGSGTDEYQVIIKTIKNECYSVLIGLSEKEANEKVLECCDKIARGAKGSEQ